ncbi:MAG: hypothetical protein JWN98_748, partial [Abditibacteriota bacterium]|nr:hypothetical protein [Abditibacteriota bacterium]
WFDPHQIDRSVKFNPRGAEDAVRAHISVVTIGHTFPNGDIDWFYNATTARADLPDNNEWQWQLNRMSFWGELGRAYWNANDEKYAQAWVKQLRSWIINCPRPDKVNNGANSAWRTIECGIRMSGSWNEAFHRFLPSPSFTTEDKVLYMKSCLEHARYLSRFPSTGNWLTMEMSGLYSAASVFPEWKEAAAWRKQAISTLHRELNAQFLPDGAQVEATPGYHQVAVDNILFIPRLAKRTERMAELPTDFTAQMEKVYNFNLFLMTPDRDLPRFNDSWPVNVPKTLQPAADLFPHRTDFAWMASGGQSGAPPKTTSHAFPYTGYFVMRSGWETDANYAVLDAGPLGYGHVHQDKLNLVVWAYGRELLFDSGGGSYERSPWRSYATDTFGHNTVLVDGKPQRRQTKNREANVSRTPLDAGWHSQNTFDYAAGTYNDGYGQEDARIATHTRRVLFIKPDLFVVADTLKPADDKEHTYQARWHLLTTQTQHNANNHTVVTADAQKPNLAIMPLQVDGSAGGATGNVATGNVATGNVAGKLEVKVASAQQEPELLGWHVRKDMDPQYVPATTVLHTRRGAGEQQILTLLVPIKAGQTNPVQSARVLPTQNGQSTRIEVLYRDGRRILVEVDRAPQSALRFQ